MSDSLEQQEQKAIDDAYGETLKSLFSTLLNNLIGEELEAASQFAKGLALARKATEVALAVISPRATSRKT